MSLNYRSLPPYIFLRGSLLYFRFSIPKDLIPIVGKAELRYSLRTGYIYLAKQRTHRLVSSLRLFIKVLRSSVQMQELTEQQIQKMLNKHLKEALQESEQTRIDSPIRPRLDDLEDKADSYSYVESDYREDLATHDYRRVHNSVDSLLDEHNIKVEKNSDSYKKLCREMMKANIKYLQVEQKRTYGDYSGELELSISGNGGKPQQTGPKFSKLFNQFVDEYIGSKRWTEKTKAENEAVFKLFTDIVGDISITDFDYETAQQYKGILRKIPANRNKKPEYRDKSLSDILEMPNVTPISISSINKNLIRMSQFMKWAQKNGHVGINVLEGLVLPEEKRKDEQRKVFTNSDLQKIFTNELFTQRKYLHSYMFWLPLLGLYTGARIEELCSLYLEDFQFIEETHIISINKNKDKKLKSKSAERIFPIHPDLVKIGLIKHIGKLKKNNEERLFPELKRERDGYSQGPSKWFGKFKSKLGFEKTSKAFHSFRHTFINSLKQLEAPPILIAEIAGHDRSDDVTLGRYGKTYKIDKVYEEIKKLDFGLDVNKFK